MKPLLRSIIILAAICNLTFIFSQPLTWQRAFRGLGNDDEGYTICKADGNNIYVAGLTSDPRCGLVIKIDQYGDTLWKKYIIGTDFIYASTGLSDGSCIVAGMYGTINRLSSNSDLIWSRANFASIYYHILQSNGSLFAAGYYDVYPNRGPTLLKMHIAGDSLWQKVYSGFGTGGFNSVIETNDGNLLLGGSLGSSIRKCFLMKCDVAGNVIWTKQYDLSLTCGIRDIDLTENGYLLTCYSFGGADTSSIILLRTNQNGDSLSSVKRRSLQYCLSAPLLKANNNRYYFAYSKYSPQTNKQAAVIVIVDSSLNILREVLIEPLIYYVWIEDMMFSPGSNNTRIACVGTTAIYNLTNEDLYVASIDTSLALPPPISVQPISNTIPNDFKLYQNCPNPFNPVTNIRFAIPRIGSNNSEPVRLAIYDALGREIEVLVNETLSPGEYEIEWNALNNPSGIYFARLTQGSNAITNKMILLK